MFRLCCLQYRVTILLAPPATGVPFQGVSPTTIQYYFNVAFSCSLLPSIVVVPSKSALSAGQSNRQTIQVWTRTLQASMECPAPWHKNLGRHRPNSHYSCSYFARQKLFDSDVSAGFQIRSSLPPHVQGFERIEQLAGRHVCVGIIHSFVGRDALDTHALTDKLFGVNVVGVDFTLHLFSFAVSGFAYTSKANK